METTKQISCDQKLWFISQNLESNSQTFYSINDRQVRHQCQVHELRGRRIRAYFHGWLILSDHSDNILWSLWNPLASKLIRLPPLKEKRYYECCLSSPPAEQGSVFVLLSHEIPAVYFCLLGPKGKKLRWTKMSYDKQLLSITGRCYSVLQCPACCGGKVYAVALSKFHSYKLLVEIDIVVNDEEVVINLLRIISIPHNICPLRNFYPFLKGFGTELFYIEVGFADKMRKTIVGVSLFKLDMTSKKGEEMVELEDGVFFLEVTSGYSACYYNYVVDMDLGGYIHILSECGKGVYSFHVKDRTLSLNSLSCQGDSQVSTCAMLEWRLEVDNPEEEEDEHMDTKIVVRSPRTGAFDNTTVFDSTTGESHLLNLPLHILELIMELFIGVEYMKFRATCKHFCLAAPSIQWRSNTRIRGYSLVSPWLMVLDNYRDTITFIDPLFGDKYYIKTPQGLRGGYEIHCAKYGWLLMYKRILGETRPVFFNPFTSNIRELPKVYNMESFCFSAPPTSPDCMVVGFRGGSRHVIIHCVLGESGWHWHNLHLNSYYPEFGSDPYFFHFTMFNVRYTYALCNNERVVAFRVMAHGGYDMKFVANEVPRRSRAQYFLSSCDQHLLLVIVGEFGRSVEVFEVDESTKEWEKIDDLGKHMIYICNTSCLCLEPKSSEMRNKIFFAKFVHDDNTKIVFYSLETCRYHTFNDNNMQESFGADLFGTKELCNPQTWIEPNWSQ